MEIKKTNRNFDITSFKDVYGQECSMQKSSVATDDYVWLGVSKPKLTVFKDNNKGQYLVCDMPDNFDVSSRMHLSREQVANLLPHLKKFVETGEIN